MSHKPIVTMDHKRMHTLDHKRMHTLDHKRMHTIGFNGESNHLDGLVDESEVKHHGNFTIVPLQLDLEKIQKEMKGEGPTLCCVLTTGTWERLKETLEQRYEKTSDQGGWAVRAEIGITNVKLVPVPESSEAK
jgi:hypothetical protein